MPELDLQPDDMPPRQRVRLHYGRGEPVKFISHQDEFRLWERTLRRAGLPLLYKQGFNPQPHMQFAAPLGVGFTGVDERLDIVLSPPVAPHELAGRIRAALPPGMTLHRAEEVALKAEALQSLVSGADYTILIYAAPGELDTARLTAAIGTFLAETTVWRVRERKGEPYTYNLRPLVLELAYQGYRAAGEEHRIFLRVQQRPGATGRPDEVVDALGFDQWPRTLRRDRLYFADDPTDAARFAAYPVVGQEEIAGPRPRGYRRRGHVAPDHAPPAGRTISQRAGDEFV